MGTLFRPVGLKELELILGSNRRAFPPRLTEQPIFYPVLNQEYAVEMARDWNVPSAANEMVARSVWSPAPLALAGQALHPERGQAPHGGHFALGEARSMISFGLSTRA